MDKELIIGYFQNIIHICDRTTTGNVSHQMSLIIRICTCVTCKMKESYRGNMVSNNFAYIAELASKITSGNIAHKVATIKGLCQRNIDFINEFGLD